MRFSRARAVALVATIAVIGAACDDDDTKLTKDDWINAAAAICQDQTDEFNQRFETDFPTTPEEATDLFGAEGGENIQAFEDGMAEFGVPECSEGEGEVIPERLDPSAFSPEKRAFVEQADALCTTSNEAIRPAEERYLEDFPPPPENWVGFLDVAKPALEEQVAGLRALEPPAEDAAEIDGLLSDAEAQIARLTQMRDFAAAGNQEEFDTASQEAFPAFDALDQALVEYGFQVCGPEEEDDGDEGE